MEKDQVTCVTCTNLRGCRLLSDSGGDLVLERIITPENPRACPEWESVGEEELLVRYSFFQDFGLGMARAIHRLDKRTNIQDKEDDVNEHIDLGSILNKGVTTRAEREEQLTFLTDEAGNFTVDETGNRVPRRNLYLRKYAIEQLGIPQDLAMFDTVKALIRRILKAEADAGWFGKPKKTKETAETEAPVDKESSMSVVAAGEELLKSAAKMPFPVTFQTFSPENPTPQPKEESMEQKSKVIVKRASQPTAAPGTVAVSPGVSRVPAKVQQNLATNAAGPRVAGPVTAKRIMSPTGGPKPVMSAPKPAAPVQAPVSGGFDMAPVCSALDDLERRVIEAVEKRLAMVTSELLDEMTHIREDMIKQHTTLHDVLVYRVQLNNSLVPVCDANGNQIVDDSQNPVFEKYTCENAHEGLLSENGSDITVYGQEDQPQESPTQEEAGPGEA